MVLNEKRKLPTKGEQPFAKYNNMKHVQNYFEHF